MDIFVEQIIRRRKSLLDILIVMGLALASCLLVLLAILYLPSMAFIILAAVVYISYLLIGSRNLEFEYSVTNGDLTVDKIMSRRTRKRVISLDCKNVEAMGKYNPAAHASKRYDKKFFTGVFADGREGWYVSLHHPKHGSVLLVFDPDERTLEAMRPFLPHKLAFEVFGRPGQARP